uniref:ATP synthase F0 subunit 8 n=1 Tax=Xenoturbella bocki TaxID=242395 RepID=A0EYM5_XENBC|nr:ATP synthase F0 subunit 8 [Xenoturbella bocki]ABG54248.1 ATP synthase F0 subunit 8 [Xenoturbella bocki]
MPQLKFSLWMTMFITTWTFMMMTALFNFNEATANTPMTKDTKAKNSKKWQNQF